MVGRMGIQLRRQFQGREAVLMDSERSRKNFVLLELGSAFFQLRHFHKRGAEDHSLQDGRFFRRIQPILAFQF
jgi:hypothetical protein